MFGGQSVRVRGKEGRRPGNGPGRVQPSSVWVDVIVTIPYLQRECRWSRVQSNRRINPVQSV